MLNKLQKMRANLKKKGKGFTLVELIVVIIIIAIIAAVAIPSITSFQESARKSRIQSEHRELVSAVQSAIGELPDPTNSAEVKKINMTTVAKYIKGGVANLASDKGGAAGSAHTITNGVLKSTFTPKTGSKTPVTFTYDFNVDN